MPARTAGGCPQRCSRGWKSRCGAQLPAEALGLVRTPGAAGSSKPEPSTPGFRARDTGAPDGRKGARPAGPKPGPAQTGVRTGRVCGCAGEGRGPAPVETKTEENSRGGPVYWALQKLFFNNGPHPS